MSKVYIKDIFVGDLTEWKSCPFSEWILCVGRNDKDVTLLYLNTGFVGRHTFSIGDTISPAYFGECSHYRNGKLLNGQ